MHHLRLNIRITMLAVAVAAVLVAGSLAPAPRQAEAGIAFTDVNGVICGYLHTLTLNTAPIPFSGTTLARIDHDLSDNTMTVTAVAYTDPTGTLDMPDCKTPQQSMPTSFEDPNFGTVPVVPNVKFEERPSVFGTYNKNNKLLASTCQADFTFGGFNMVDGTIVTLQLDISDNEPTVQSTGSFTFENIFTDGTCSVEGGGGLGTLVVLFDALFLDGPDEPKSAFDSDWDKDGNLDWHELNPNLLIFTDPFAGPAVGGVAELAEAAGTPLDAPDSSGASTGLIAGVLAAVAAGVVALGGAAWYTKRRM